MEENLGIWEGEWEDRGTQAALCRAGGARPLGRSAAGEMPRRAIPSAL